MRLSFFIKKWMWFLKFRLIRRPIPGNDVSKHKPRLHFFPLQAYFSAN